jgi:glycerol-3-phosphate dehydrogenase
VIATDLVILGGGITGLGIARLASRNGWSVTLVERGDLASGASSASSHMLHGGLRYLEHGHLRLVREALGERAAIARMAPALTTPVRFLVPLTRGSRLPAWKLRAGLALYDVLAGSRGMAPHSMARAAEAASMEPALARDGLLGAGLYSDGVMDDARLAVAVARDAAAHGARILTHTQLVSAKPSSAEPGTHDVVLRENETRSETHLRAKLFVNATGAWSDATRLDMLRMLRPGASDPKPQLGPSRGVHLVYPALTRSHGLLITAASDGRVFFVVPFAGRSLVGTTEVETLSPPEPAQCVATTEEIRYLARELARVLPGSAAARPLAVMSGVRPLLRADSSAGDASREHRVTDDGPLLTIAGGKWTTFRIMAREVLHAAAPKLGRDLRSLDDPALPLPVPLHASADAIAVAAHAVEHEFARHLEDVLRRRSSLWLADDRGMSAAPAVAGAMARRLGWTPAQERDESAAWEHHVHEQDALLDRALEKQGA